MRPPMPEAYRIHVFGKLVSMGDLDHRHRQERKAICKLCVAAVTFVCAFAVGGLVLAMTP